MSDSTSLLTQLTTAQAGKEATVNELMNAISPTSAFGRRQSSSGLSWDYYGLSRWHINTTATTKANTTLTLTASSTRYVSADRALAVTEVATAFAVSNIANFGGFSWVPTVKTYSKRGKG